MTAVLPLETPEAVDECSASAVAAFVGAQVFDVLSGRKPVHQVREHVSGHVAGLLLATRLHAAQGPDYRLRSVHACPVTEFTVEACMVVGTQDRVRALVLRVEQDNGQWVCTRLSLV
ncbi:Rv3235 family protein [Saccharopolyspora sp. K220]|uniref:Rv3235 family protein n=1 Tax=Saccharopolyspora soli TaxID=2926618 RepID=UPI001F5975B6|nr:Rv3235 family protein [Saccharopolyspora soli]MCI2422158.1 Rv3235 family protein [Saccharopolyspora soli]